MAKIRKTQFWLDDQAGALRDFTDQINSAALNRAAEMLETTALNDDDKEQQGNGLRSYTIPLNGYFHDTGVDNTSIALVLFDSQGTSVTKTWQHKVGVNYFYGEAVPAGLEMPADGKALVMWSCTLEGTGSVTRTSVAQS